MLCNTSEINNYYTAYTGHEHEEVAQIHGNLVYPDGNIILGNAANLNGDITRGSHNQQIRLNRKRPDVMSPTGVYTCEVPNEVNMIHTATITLSLGECAK